MKNNKKLVFKKEKIAQLGSKEMSNLQGGVKRKSQQNDVCFPGNRSFRSSNHGFGCCLCTGGTNVIAK